MLHTTEKKQIKNLLSKGATNAKTAKNELETYILYMAPSNIVPGVDLCPFASPECRALCLNTAGRGIFSNVQLSRINKTELWRDNREQFYLQLGNELLKIHDQSIKQNKKIAIRLNGTSDVDHLGLLLRYTGIIFLDVFYSDLIFYDYTKNINHVKKYKNSRYHLTFSRSECNDQQVEQAINLGVNIAVVFRNQLPATYKGLQVINGDLSDLRINDPKNCIIGLIAKGKAKKQKSNFVVSTEKTMLEQITEIFDKVN
jgi:hypothetical protein